MVEGIVSISRKKDSLMKRIKKKVVPINLRNDLEKARQENSGWL